MAEGKIILSDFELEIAEEAIVDNLIKNYQHKIQEKIQFEEIRLRLKKSEHGKVFLHEVQGLMTAGKRYNAEASDYNLFAATAEVLEKLLHEAEHDRRTARQKK
ncbi:MAG: hypothetical protein NT076_00800 [Candidatus Pacearchaeota archaeon]|nr:hypothetical protein [Candidatus Pacearchaeota archaeon]